MLNNEMQAFTDTIRTTFASVVWTHKIHEKDADINIHNSDMIKKANIVASTITCGGIFAILNDWGFPFLNFISGTASIFTIVITFLQNCYNFEEKSHIHKKTAIELLEIRDKLLMLLSDISDLRISEDEAVQEFKVIKEKIDIVYKLAPITSKKAYIEADKALARNREYSYAPDEIDRFLPPSLRQVKR